jgi:hypothetical protein
MVSTQRFQDLAPWPPGHHYANLSPCLRIELNEASTTAFDKFDEKYVVIIGDDECGLGGLGFIYNL